MKNLIKAPPKFNTTVVAYGAASERPAMPSIAWRLREWARREYYAQLTISRTKRSGRIPPLAYQDHSSNWFVNHGDVAIADTLISHVIPEGNATVERRNWQPAASRDWLDQINSQKIVMICGGGYLFLDSAGRVAKRLASDLAEFRRSGAAFGLIGVGINQLTENATRNDLEPDKEDLRTINGLFDEAKFASVRDVATQDYVSRATGKSVPLSGDPALFIVNPDDQTKVKPRNNERLQIGLSLPFHGTVVDQHLNRCLSAVVAAINEIQARLNCEFHYFSHYDGELILPRLLGRVGVNCRIHRGSVGALMSGYEQLDAHIGGMLHSCILASNYNIPLIGLAYDTKHSGLFNVLGLPNQKLNLEPTTMRELPAILEKTLENGAEISGKILAARQALATPYRTTIKDAQSLLTELG